MSIVTIRELKSVRVSYFLGNLIGTFILITQLPTRSFARLVLC
jgi:hypothetical protein